VFFDATFTDCKFVGSRFDRCTFDLLKVRGGNWSFVSLSRADLSSATLHDVRMQEADLSGAMAHGTSIRGCDLSGAAFDGADLEDGDLRGSTITYLDPSTVRLRGAVVDLHQAVMIAEALGLDVRSD
jgi:uncharacterized protein YjbI with pentapeptide repeats